jgi:hypothetical protein
MLFEKHGQESEKTRFLQGVFGEGLLSKLYEELLKFNNNENMWQRTEQTLHQIR